MEKITGNEPINASPKQVIGSGEDYHEIARETGLTIRQHFAVMAMQGILSNSVECGKNRYLYTCLTH